MQVGKPAPVANHAEEKPRLHVKIIEFLQEENRMAQHTEMYDLQYPVLRRGTPFKLKIQFEGVYNSNDHAVNILFATGSKPLYSKRTCVKMALGEKSKLSGWSAEATADGKPITPDVKTDEILVTVQTPPDAIVGSYQIYVEADNLLFNYNGCAFLIFNPWEKDDACYMSDEKELEEYVLNEDGIIYLGSAISVIPRYWHYGQFEKYFLETALWLLEKAGLHYEEFGDPTIVTRTLAAMVNASGNGVLAAYDGSEKYAMPHDWPGSVSIIKPFLTKKATPVKYGDCGTFAGLFCTLARSLGIPCRVVTCYNAVHNAEKYGKIDIHWSKENAVSTALNTDQLWVRHTWNEVWFKRPDIPENLQGWQAVDCTPDSASESLYRLGPCPVKAIQTGAIGTTYDAPLIYAMANGRVVHWDVLSSIEMIPIAIEQDVVASKILTKGLGEEPVEIQANYKGTPPPKEAACDEEIAKMIAENNKTNDVILTVSPPADVDMGDFIPITIKMENKSDQPRTIEIYMRSFYENYKGVLGEICKIVNGERVRLTPNSEKSHQIKIRAEDYKARQTPPFLIKVYLRTIVTETKQKHAEMFNIDFKPFNMLRIDVPVDEILVGQPFACTIAISNPLRKPLRNCILSIEAQEFTRSIKLTRSIKPAENVTLPAHLMLRREGQSTIYVCLKSNDVLASEAIHAVEVVHPSDKKSKEDEGGDEDKKSKEKKPEEKKSEEKKPDAKKPEEKKPEEKKHEEKKPEEKKS